MKTLSVYIIGVIMIMFNSMPLHAENESKTPLSANPIENVKEAETDILVERIEYLKEMDKSGFEPTEKRELRKEVRSIQKELVQRGTYIYISGTALIIILLLIILL
jgi:hypothetical protein